MKRKRRDYSSRDRTERSGKRESCFWQKKVGHEKGQGENTGKQDNCWMDATEDPGGMVIKTQGKRLTLGRCAVALGQGRQKKRWWRAGD